MSAIIVWTIKGALFAVLVGGLMYAHQSLTTLRQQVAEQERALESKPDQLFYKAAAEAELARHDFDIKRIQQYTPRREQIIDLVSAIEGEGGAAEVNVSISDIKEELVLNADGKPVVAAGPLQDIAISVVATGSPEDLLTFLYRVDHMPYLMYVKSWNLSPDRTPQAPSVSAGDPDETPAPNTPQSRLEIDVIMSSMIAEL